jgi:integrase
VVDELITSNPCVLKRGELPGKIDKDPTWRSGAVFTREEVERLISDERVPEDRRLFYAVAFLAGLRTGEVSALRWRAYDSEVERLRKLLVAASFNTRTRTEKWSSRRLQRLAVTVRVTAIPEIRKTFLPSLPWTQSKE